ncbi:uncharacterized protein [Onthophagus taurus]|uniref:uncharacterized protein n=1 Tax=Onthophagus taurus TaxID=166361 RepID=UPI0039BDEFBD
MDRNCYICGRSVEEVVKLFSFPLNINKQRSWNECLGVPAENTYSRRMRICNNHFTMESFMLNKTPLTLKRDAKPLRVIMNEAHIITSESLRQPELEQDNLTDSVIELNITKDAAIPSSATNPTTESVFKKSQSSATIKEKSLRRILKKKEKQIRRLKKNYENKTTLEPLRDMLSTPECVCLKKY